MHGMQIKILKRLGHLDKRLVVRYAHQSPAAKATLIASMKRNCIMKKKQPHHTMELLKTPSFRFTLLFTLDEELIKKSQSNLVFATSKVDAGWCVPQPPFIPEDVKNLDLCGYDDLTVAVYRTLYDQEKEIGFLHGVEILRDLDCVGVEMPHNNLDINTRYWHKKTTDKRFYVACETTLFDEHKTDVTGLLKGL